LLIWPPDIPVGGLRFYRGSSFFLSFYLNSSVFFYFRPLPSELGERNSTKTGHLLRSKCDLKSHVRNVRYVTSLEIGAPKPYFCDDVATQRQI